MTKRRGFRATAFAAALGGLVGLEALGVAVLGAPGARLRTWVDLLTVQGLVLGAVGGLLAAERPFLAARALRAKVAERRGGGGVGGLAEGAVGEADGVGAGDEGLAVSSPDPSSRRRAGLWILAGGCALFGAAALIWAIGGEPSN